jgi:hypothetical protein
MFHWARTTALENHQDSMLLDIATALVPINSTVWKTAQQLIVRNRSSIVRGKGST